MAVLMNVLAHHDFPGDGIRRNDSVEFDARRRTSASPLSSKIARDACSNYCKPPLWRLVYERSICVWTWNRAREIRLAARTRQGFFSGLDSIIIHRLHRRRVLIIRLERARRMDREEWLSGRKSGEREREREEICHACAPSSPDTDDPPPTRRRCIFQVSCFDSFCRISPSFVVFRHFVIIIFFRSCKLSNFTPCRVGIFNAGGNNNF